MVSWIRRAWVLCCVGALACAVGSDEAERERALVAAVVPDRLANDGTVRLTDRDRIALDLVTAAASIGELAITHTRIGWVRARPQDEAIVASPIAERVVGLTDVVPGTALDAATVLAQLAPVLATGEQVVLGTQRAELEGRVRSARQELTLKEATLARARELAVDAVVSRQAFDEAASAVASSSATLAALERARAVQRRGGGGTVELRSPFEGRLVGLTAELGAVVAAGAVVARCRRDGPRWVEVAVPSDEPIGVRHRVRLGERWTDARLLARGVQIVGGMRRDLLELGDPGLTPGANVEVEVATGSVRGTVIPDAAVLATAAGERVFVEVSPGVFAEREIRVGVRAGGTVLVTDGLAAGEVVVTQGGMALVGERGREALRPEE